MKLVSRADALTQGLSRFNTGKPCKNGHISDRYTKGEACVKCQADRMAHRYYGHNIIRSEIVKVAKQIGELAKHTGLIRAYTEYEAISTKPDILTRMEAIRAELQGVADAADFENSYIK